MTDSKAVLSDLEAAARRGDDLLAERAQLRVDGADDERAVVVTADGHGQVVDLRMSDAALRYPQRVGVRVTAAVRDARRTAAAAAEEHAAAHFPGRPSLEDVGDALSPPPEQVDLQAVDYPGSVGVRHAIAEGMEARQQVEAARLGFAEHRVRQEIGTAAGTVVMDGVASRVKVEVRPQAVHNVGAQRLSGQIVEALRQAEARAEQHRMAAMDRIDVAGTALGALVRHVRHSAGIREGVRR